MRRQRSKSKSFDLEAEAQRLFHEARARGDATGGASVLRLIKDLEKSTPPEPLREELTAEQLEARLLHMLNRYRVSRGQPPVAVPDAQPLASDGEVTSWLRGLTARGVRWRLFESGSLCLDEGWLTSEDLVFVLVNTGSEAMRAVHVEHRRDATLRQPISTLQSAAGREAATASWE